MKVLILGPVVNEKTSGGVAVFDEGLCKGFIENGDDANILSLEKSSLIDNIVVGNKQSTSKRILMKFRKIAKVIKQNEPDLVISSLQYSLGIRKYKRKWPHAKYVQILHGTPSPVNGRFKAWCVNYVARYSKKYFDKLVTVSHLSWAINKKINRVECDEIINTGCSIKAPNTNFQKKYDFCYVGRLYRDKNVDKMMEAFIRLHEKNSNIKVCIVGYGEQDYLFNKGGKYDLDFVYFKGKLNHDDVSKVYSESRFFVSLCELEACGLAFSEAAICKCNPVASLSSGQTEFFRDFDFYHTVDASSIEKLTNDLEIVLSNYVEITSKDVNKIADFFSYKSIARKYKDLFKTEF